MRRAPRIVRRDTRATFTTSAIGHARVAVSGLARLTETLDGHLDLVLVPGRTRSEVTRALAGLRLEVAWSATSWGFGVVRRVVLFEMDGERVELGAMLGANEEDEALCRWLRDAEVGERFVSGTGATVVHCVEV